MLFFKVRSTRVGTPCPRGVNAEAAHRRTQGSPLLIALVHHAPSGKIPKKGAKVIALAPCVVMLRHPFFKLLPHGRLEVGIDIADTPDVEVVHQELEHVGR